MVRRMQVVDYCFNWPMQYEREVDTLRSVLGDEIVRAHHIGSTAVPGLAAKPIIDILLEVRSVDRLDLFDAAMEEIGYRPRGELGIPGRRYYTKGGDQRTHHVHAFVTGDLHVEKHLVFRDYLRTHPQSAADYAAVKREAAAAHETDPEEYMAFKHGFVERMVARSMDWAAEGECRQSATEQENGE